MEKYTVDDRYVMFPATKFAIEKLGLQSEPSSKKPVLIWHDSISSQTYFQDISPWQVINRIPYSKIICRKVSFVLILKQFQRVFPSIFKFLPESYALPFEAEEFQKRRKENPNKKYILKPSNGSLGQGIEILSIGDRCEIGNNMYVAQELINPLLIENRKFDFRIYALVTSVNPVVIYVYRDGIARFCAEEFDPESTNPFSQLTNVTLNKNFKDVDIASISRLISEIVPLLQQKGIKMEDFWKQVDNAIVATIISASGTIAADVRRKCPTFGFSRCFQIFGFDVILDKNLRPYVLEVNYRPSMIYNRGVEKQLKVNVIKDAIRLGSLNSIFTDVVESVKSKWSSDEFIDFCISNQNVIKPSKNEINAILAESLYEKVWPRKDNSAIKLNKLYNYVQTHPFIIPFQREKHINNDQGSEV